MTQTSRAVLALGSNQGNRVKHLEDALNMLALEGVKTLRHSCLYDSSPAYVTNQPRFVNGAVLVETSQSPAQLLNTAKAIELQLGRDPNTVRYGPRPIDIDILMYDDVVMDSTVQLAHGGGASYDASLTIPHPGVMEREFVLAPLGDLVGDDEGATRVRDESTCGKVYSSLIHAARTWWSQVPRGTRVLPNHMSRIIPMKSDYMLQYGASPLLMGVINATPDSFSDGGIYKEPSYLSAILSLLYRDAHIVDIGAHSTRPNATRVSAEEEVARLLPSLSVWRHLAASPPYVNKETGQGVHAADVDINDAEVMQHLAPLPRAVLSVDTTNADVAQFALDNGADIVNDVSGGGDDERMLSVVASASCAYSVMHMRGAVDTHMSDEHTQYDNVIHEVAGELRQSLDKAVAAGVPSWRLLIDPGIGFSKTKGQNLTLMANISKLKQQIGAPYINLPLVVGVSRKSTIGAITGQKKPNKRDFGTAGMNVVLWQQGADVLRVHNVSGTKDAVMCAQAVWDARMEE